ncbi:MAG: SLBB domain-containing protein [Deltaproteobacteria bacterium]|nr:SLBB domain-containing protein [Deltaproteobacteria bacterium]
MHIAQQLALVLLLVSIASADYGLLLSSFRSKESALQHANSLAKQTQRVIAEEIQMPGSGTWYRVCVGPFSTKGEALEQKKAMRLNGYTGDIIVVRVNPANLIASGTPDKETPPPVQTKAALPRPQGTLTIEWDPGRDPGLVGYKIYYDTDSGPPYEPDAADYADEGPSPVRVGRDVTKITLHGLNGTKKYFFAITSLNTKGEESAYSTEVAALPEHRDTEAPGAGETQQIKVKPAAPPPAPVGATGVSDDRKIEPIPAKEPSALQSSKIPAAVPRSRYRKPLPPPPVSQPALPVPAPARGEERESLIAPGDILRIEVPGQKEMSFDYDVDPDGNIYMLMVGKIGTQGLSESGLSDKLTREARKFIAKGDRVLVQIVGRRRYVYIQGGVRYPGWYRVPSKISVDDLLNMSGGALSKEVRGGISLHRKVGGEEKKFGVTGDSTLWPNDIITVPMPKTYRKEADKGDLLFISIPQRQAPSGRPDTWDSADLTQSLAQNKIEIDRNGYIYLPNYGHILVNNLTTEEIKGEIEARLPKYLAILQKVEVSIIEKKHYVQVLGHVTNPGWYNVPETANIQEVVSIAGGAIDGATMSDVVIQRDLGGGARKVEVNLYQFTITGDNRLLTPIHENDVVFVPITSNFGNIKRTLNVWTPPTERLEEDVKEKVRIFGAVHNPGIYEVEEDMNLVDLMVLASGEDQYAELTDIAIIRNGKVITRFDLEEFLHGKAKGGTKPLPKIQGGDTVYVTRIETTTKEAQDRVYVVGKVLRPGSYELYDDMTVLQGLAWAGGLNEWADSNNIMIVRMVDGKQENIPFNYDKGVRGRVPEVNIRLAPNDTIIVP